MTITEIDELTKLRAELERARQNSRVWRERAQTAIEQRDRARVECLYLIKKLNERGAF